MSKKTARRYTLSDADLEEKKRAEKICEEKGWGYWTYNLPTRAQKRTDTGEIVG